MRKPEEVRREEGAASPLGGPSPWSSQKWLWLFLAGYATALACLLSKLSLWLDEILDLIGACNPSLSALLAYVPVNAGGVPLGYLAQFAVIRSLGCSAFSGRLPSAVFSVLACAGIFVLAQHFRLRWPLLAVALFAFCPLQLRYAMEARSYSQALCLTIWSTVVFLQLLDRSASLARVLLYGGIIALGLYTQPFTVFVPAAHFLWLCAAAPGVGRRVQLALFSGAAVLGGALAFAPWYLHAAALWRRSVVESLQVGRITLHVLPVILHELTGAGYLGMALVLGGVLLGLQRSSNRHGQRWFWMFYLFVPVTGTLTADAVFGYFFAIRQVIFVIPPLALLAAVGAEGAAVRGWRIGSCLAGAFLVVALYQDADQFRRPRENWQAAAQFLKTKTANGDCIVFTPEDSHTLYTFFSEELRGRECRPEQLSAAHRVALAVSPYLTAEQQDADRRRLVELGFQRETEFNPSGPKVELYRRAHP